MKVLGVMRNIFPLAVTAIWSYFLFTYGSPFFNNSYITSQQVSFDVKIIWYGMALTLACIPAGWIFLNRMRGPKSDADRIIDEIHDAEYGPNYFGFGVKLFISGPVGLFAVPYFIFRIFKPKPLYYAEE